jgi:hypothetical protein
VSPHQSEPAHACDRALRAPDFRIIDHHAGDTRRAGESLPTPARYLQSKRQHPRIHTRPCAGRIRPTQPSPSRAVSCAQVLSTNLVRKISSPVRPRRSGPSPTKNGADAFSKSAKMHILTMETQQVSYAVSSVGGPSSFASCQARHSRIGRSRSPRWGRVFRA